MNLEDFTVAQEIIEGRNPVRINWNIAVDIGFSSVKGMSPNKRFCFPSYVKKIEESLTTEDDEDIYYKDDDGLYLVGEKAQDLIKEGDTNDTDSFFDRERYFSKDFLILARTAVAIGMMDNKERKRIPQVKTFIQTGLPAAYLKADARLLRSAFAQSCTYYIKIGRGPWEKFENTLKTNISVMSQPAGTLNSIMVDDFGQYHEDKKKLLSQNILIADIGFGTFDPYGLINREVALHESIDNLGMKKVLETASENIYRDYKVDLRISQMRKCVREGYFKVTDIRNKSCKKVPVAPYIEKACKKVAETAIDKLYEMARQFRDYDILVVTGGTGAAWFPYIKDAFSGIDTLEVIPGNDGCSVPIHYANVRGYYMSAYLQEKNPQ